MKKTSEYLLDKLCALFQDLRGKSVREKQAIYLEIDDIRQELLKRLN